MKKRNRKKLGRTIETPRTYERNITREEKINGSPYWDWMEKHGPQNEDGDIQEFASANPDVLAEGEMVPQSNGLDTENIKNVLRLALTDKQCEVMMLVLDGYSQLEIARNLDIKQAYVSQAIKASREKLKDYLL